MVLILLLVVLLLALARAWPYSRRWGYNPNGTLTAVSTRRGIVAMIFGLLAFYNPGTTLNYLVVFFGAYAILDGLATIDAAGRAVRRYRPFVVEGVISVMAGALTFLWPANAAIIMLYLMAFWAVFSGRMEIVAGDRLFLMRTLILLFGFAILIVPITGILPITTWFGVAALVFGILSVTLAIRRRAFGREAIKPSAISRAA